MQFGNVQIFICLPDSDFVYPIIINFMNSGSDTGLVPNQILDVVEV